VKSRRSGSDKNGQAGLILETLAEKLPDHILEEYFKGISPTLVRRVLSETAKLLAPPQEQKSIKRSQASLWPGDREKTWSGKLAGQSLLLFTDGASRGNPGQAGAGIAILDEQGSELVGTSLYLGKCTNNEAEYRALLFGLDTCAEFGRGRLKIHLDSELIVKQIRGEYKVKHPNLKQLHQKVMQKLKDFSGFSITHVRREKNSRADELANKAIDEHLQD
jgi:ribonuclease HI